MPEIEILSAGRRHLIHGNYRSICRISGKTVIILRVIHGTRLLDMDP